MGFLSNALINLIPHGLYDRLYNRVNNQRSFLFGNTNAVWIDTDRPYELYEAIPQLKTIINRKAKMFSNLEWKIFNTNDGKEIEDTQLLTLLKNPNVLQSMQDFLEQYKIQESVYGNQFIYKFKPSALSDYPSALWNVSPKFLKLNLSGKIFEQTEIDKIILSYEYTEAGKVVTYNTQDILYTKENDLDNPVIGTSKTNGLQKVLTNIDAAYQYRNVIMRKRGMLGFISRGEDKHASLNGSKLEEEIHKQFQSDYGIGNEQIQIAFVNAVTKWNAISYPTKDLMLFEEVDADTLTIIDAYGMNANIFSSKVSTYENVKQSLISVYQDTIIPEADKLAFSLSKFLKLPENYNLQASYGHIEILKQNTNYNDVYPLISILTNSIDKGMLTVPQATTILLNELNKYLNTDGLKKK